MLTLSCPSCGANVEFKSKSSVFAVCSYCKTSLVRQDTNLEAVGKMADLQDEMTPFQVGTTGMYGGEKFEIVGRLKVAYTDGFWNEWYVLFGKSDKQAWLAEAQGFLALCFPRKISEALPSVQNLKPGKHLTIDGVNFEVNDVFNVSCIYSEGELPVNAVKGRESVSVDLSNAVAEMATIEVAPDQTRVFVGDYCEFDDFQFANLRRLDGW